MRFEAELLRFIMLWPARGLEQSRGEDIELHVLVSEKGGGGEKDFMFTTGDIQAVFANKLTDVDDLYVLQGADRTATTAD